MKQIYLDQNITKALCKKFDFFSRTFSAQFKPSPTLIMTPQTLIELSGNKIIHCLKEDNKYKIDISDSLINQWNKACYFYKNNMRGNIITFLKKGLKKQRKHVKTKLGRYIFTEYEQYLNSVKGIEDICHSILWDRISALPLEQFKNKNTYLYIYGIALDFLSVNPHIPCLRLFIKSYKKLPSPVSEQEKNEFRKPMEQLIETSDLKENGDLVDIEIVQLAVIGYKSYPVHFYTKDSSEKIKKRLFLLYSLLKESTLGAQELLKKDIDKQNVDNLSLKK